jgi:uncharacterized protein (DUF1778 family)
MSQTAKAMDRLEARLPSEQKQLFERAADLQGTTLTDFVLANLQAAATATIKEFETLRLRGEDRKVFINALLNPPKANQFAKDAVARYKKQVSY